MIKEQRQNKILEILRQHEMMAVQSLAAMLPDCSVVTIRRDIVELAKAGAVRRTHGGVALPDNDQSKQPSPVQAPMRGTSATILKPDDPSSELNFDAIILPPISSRGAEALRRQVRRQGLPFIAESAPQEGGVYLGPDNEAAGRDLGRVAGRQLTGVLTDAHVLIITQVTLPNANARAEGFEQGLRETFQSPVTFYRVNGQNDYKPSLRAASDAIQANPMINVVFGVNDHSAMAGGDAARRHDKKLPVYAVGGERADFVAQVAEGGTLKAVAAYFPEVVGLRAMDMMAGFLCQTSGSSEPYTPHAIITADNLTDFYAEDAPGWQLKAKVRDRMVGSTPQTMTLRPQGTIAFMPHYPAHDWYRVMIQAMQSRAAHFGLDLVIARPDEGISRELTRLRRQIATAATEHVTSGQTIIIGEGEIGVHLASEVRALAGQPEHELTNLTVITNSLDVLDRLTGVGGVKVILTSGEYQPADRCLVGPSLEALFELMRADRAFLSVGGVSARLGITSVDERLALVGQRFVRAAREVIAMTDHTMVGWEANHRISRIEDIDLLITDDGSPPQERLALSSAGVGLQVVSDDAADNEGSEEAGVTDWKRRSGAFT